MRTKEPRCYKRDRDLAVREALGYRRSECIEVTVEMVSKACKLTVGKAT